MVSASLVAPEVQQAFEGILAREAEAKAETTPKVAKATKAEPEPEAVAEPVETTEEAGDSEVAVDAEAEDEVVAGEDPDAAASEDAPIEMFADVAKALGRSEDEALAALKIPGLDGKPVPLADVVKAYRETAQTGELKSQLEAKYTEFDGMIQAFEQQRDQEFGQIQALTAKLIEKVEGDRKIDWDAMEKDDPQGYAIAKLKAQDREAAVRAALQAQHAEKTRLDAGLTQQRQKWQADEAVKLLKARPEFVPQAARQEAMSEVTGLLDKMGLKPQEVGDFLPDHRVFQIIHWAAQYLKLQAKEPLTLKALKSVPKVVGPQGRPPVRDARTEKMKKLRGELEKRGDIASAAAIFEEMFQ